MPNKGYFIQQITRRGAGTLFDEGVGKDKVATSSVNSLFRYFAKKAACSRKRATQFFMYSDVTDAPRKTPTA